MGTGRIRKHIRLPSVPTDGSRMCLHASVAVVSFRAVVHMRFFFTGSLAAKECLRTGLARHSGVGIHYRQVGVCIDVQRSNLLISECLGCAPNSYQV